MKLDFSIIKNIDLNSSNNVLFFVIVFLLGIIFVSIVSFIIYEIVKSLVRLFKKIFFKDDDLKVVVKELEESKEERKEVEEKVKHLAAKGLDAPPVKSKQEDKSAKKVDTKENSKIEIPTSKKINGQKQPGGEGPSTPGVGQGMPESGNPKIEIPISKKVEEQKKSGPVNSSIPDVGKGASDTIGSKIEIPTSKKKDDAAVNTSKVHQGNIIEKAIEKGEVKIGSGLIIPKTEKHKDETVAIHENKPIFEEKSKNNVVIATGHSKNDGSIFGGKEEISRLEFKEKLRSSESAYRADIASDLKMSPLERANIEKQVFPSVYGQNISRSDVKSVVKNLTKKLGGISNSKVHERVRKEINFLKKIGGIK